MENLYLAVVASISISVFLGLIGYNFFKKAINGWDAIENTVLGKLCFFGPLLLLMFCQLVQLLFVYVWANNHALSSNWLLLAYLIGIGVATCYVVAMLIVFILAGFLSYAR